MQVPESLTGGLVTARDPSTLLDGELSRADNLVYRVGDIALHKAEGRLLNGSVGGVLIEGIGFCAFEGLADQVLVAAGSALYKASYADRSMVFSNLGSYSAGQSLEAIHYNNKYYLLGGADANRVMDSTGAIQNMGMLPVTETPTISVTSTGGTWPLSGSSATGTNVWYEYWITEVDISDTGEEVESEFTGLVARANIQTTTYYVTIYRPGAIRNSRATHWRLYRSVATTPEAPGFPDGWRVGTYPITVASANDGLTSTVGPQNAATVFSAGLGWTGATAGNLAVDDAFYATLTVRGDVAAAQPIELGAFGMTAATEPVNKIMVDVVGVMTTATPTKTLTGGVVVYLSWNAGASWTTAYRMIPLVGVLTPTLFSIELPWNEEHDWVAADFSDANFRVKLVPYVVPKSGATAAEAEGSFTLDRVRTRVKYGGTEEVLTDPYNFVEMTIGGLSARVGADGPPPTASMGDMFQDCMVTNDMSQRDILAYSLASKPESFPSVYRLRMGTRQRDDITAIRTLGNILIVGLNGAIWRLNYLPTEENADADWNAMRDEVDAYNGIVSQTACCRFTHGGQAKLAYVSRSGVRLTDGYLSDSLSDDIRLEDYVSDGHWDKCLLINDPTHHRLVLYYVPKGGSSRTKALLFHYHAMHLKQGRAKVTGPVDVSVTCATTGVRTNGELVVLTGSSGGGVYHDWVGYLDEGGNDRTPRFSTRELYLAGPGSEWRLDQLLVHHQAPEETELTVTCETTKTNGDPRVHLGKDVRTVRRGFTRVETRVGGEGIIVHGEGRNDGKALAVDYLVLDISGMGKETSLR